MTPKQERFCHEYLVDLNATQSAIRAGYSERTAYRTGADLLKKPQVAAHILSMQEKRAVKTGLNAEWAVEKLRLIADDEGERTSDRIKAIELIGKHFAAFTDRVEQVGNSAAQVVIVIVIPDNGRSDRGIENG